MNQIETNNAQDRKTELTKQQVKAVIINKFYNTKLDVVVSSPTLPCTNTRLDLLAIDTKSINGWLVFVDENEVVEIVSRAHEWLDRLDSLTIVTTPETTDLITDSGLDVYIYEVNYINGFASIKYVHLGNTRRVADDKALLSFLTDKQKDQLPSIILSIRSEVIKALRMRYKDQFYSYMAKRDRLSCGVLNQVWGQS